LSTTTRLPEAISKPQAKTTLRKPSRRDFARYAKSRLGITDEDIALAEPHGPVDPQKIRESIQAVATWQQINSLPIVTASAHEIILKHFESLDQIIGEFATATKTRTISEVIEVLVDGKPTQKHVVREIVEIDYNTRARVIEHLKDLRDMVASKESKTNVNFGTQVGSVTNIGGRSFEDRIHKKREARGLTNDVDSSDPVPLIEDAEFEDDVEEEVIKDESSS
jgi:hypothetical protein